MSNGFLIDIASTGSDIEVTLPIISFVTGGSSFLRRNMTDLAESVIGFDLPKAAPIASSESGLLMGGNYLALEIVPDVLITFSIRQNNRKGAKTVEFRPLAIYRPVAK